MSSISYGETAEQAAVKLLSIIADPSYKDKVAELKKTLEAIGSEQGKNAQRLRDAIEAEKRAEQYNVTSAKAVADAQKLNNDTEDRRAEIARRQDEWERNLNTREAELTKAQSEHSARAADFEVYKKGQSEQIANRSAALGQLEYEYDKRKRALDQREAELNVQAQAAAEFVSRFKK